MLLEITDRELLKALSIIVVMNNRASILPPAPLNSPRWFSQKSTLPSIHPSILVPASRGMGTTDAFSLTAAVREPPSPVVSRVYSIFI
jgi:hypothetical protein